MPEAKPIDETALQNIVAKMHEEDAARGGSAKAAIQNQYMPWVIEQGTLTGLGFKEVQKLAFKRKEEEKATRLIQTIAPVTIAPAVTPAAIDPELNLPARPKNSLPIKVVQTELRPATVQLPRLSAESILPSAPAPVEKPALTVIPPPLPQKETKAKAPTRDFVLVPPKEEQKTTPPPAKAQNFTHAVIPPPLPKKKEAEPPINLSFDIVSPSEPKTEPQGGKSVPSSVPPTDKKENLWLALAGLKDIWANLPRIELNRDGNDLPPIPTKQEAVRMGGDDNRQIIIHGPYITGGNVTINNYGPANSAIEEQSTKKSQAPNPTVQTTEQPKGRFSDLGKNIFKRFRQGNISASGIQNQI